MKKLRQEFGTARSDTNMDEEFVAQKKKKLINNNITTLVTTYNTTLIKQCVCQQGR